MPRPLRLAGGLRARLLGLVFAVGVGIAGGALGPAARAADDPSPDRAKPPLPAGPIPVAPRTTEPKNPAGADPAPAAPAPARGPDPAALVAGGAIDALIPRRALLTDPQRAQPRVSPDGQRLAYLAPHQGVTNLWIAPVGGTERARAVTGMTDRPVRSFQWAFNNEHVLVPQDAGGDENWKILAVNTSTGETTDLTPQEAIEGAQGVAPTDRAGRPLRPAARILGLSPRFPDQALLVINARDPRYFDVHAVDLRTGENIRLFANDGFAWFLADQNLSVRLAGRPTPEGGMDFYRNTAADPAAGPYGNTAPVWEKWFGVGPEDVELTQPVGLDETGETFYLVDSRGRDTSALVALDMAGGAATVLAESRDADVSDVLRHPVTGRPEAVAFNRLLPRWTVVTSTGPAEAAEDLERLLNPRDRSVRVVSRSQDDRLWTLSVESDREPAVFLLLDRQAPPAKPLFASRPGLPAVRLPTTRALEITARDGLRLVSYLTLPPRSDSDGDAVPEAPVPLVLLVHGGPWARDAWGFNPVHQWLANRGYAVLSVNFRGSTGFGKAFVNAGDRQWAGAMHTDLLDAVNWAVAGRVADPERVAIMGGSYGGYATLVGMTFTPEVFACGVAMVAPSNLQTLLETIPPYWQPLLDRWARRVGDPRTPEGRALLQERSPLNRVDRISRPLLVTHGANDPRVKRSESDQLIAAMQLKNLPVTYLLFPDEGHGVARAENRLAQFGVIEAFLARHLGGRFEALGDDVRHSSMEVPTGAAEIPGLVEALPEGR